MSVDGLIRQTGGGVGVGEVRQLLRLDVKKKKKVQTHSIVEALSFLDAEIKQTPCLPPCPPSLLRLLRLSLQVSHDFAVNFNEENPECAGECSFDFLFEKK